MRVKKKKNTGLDFEIDKLTRSIENVATGDSFQTELSLLTNEDLKTMVKKHGWQFNWKSEYNSIEKEVYKLTIVNNPLIVQGLISLEYRNRYVYMHLLENAPFNLGKNKMYAGVAGNLVAFACLRSFQTGGDGYVSFQSKTKLIEHYKKTLGATQMRGQDLVIETGAALKLVQQYFK